MNVLVTGATGYIGSRIIPRLIAQGHRVYALARNSARITDSRIEVIEGDLTAGPIELPDDIEAAYYLIHSMSSDPQTFAERDRQAAAHFISSIEASHCKQIIYLTGLVSDTTLSKHLQSRLEVETILKQSSIPVTSLRAAIIIGSGSASFEIIRDLVEKLPIMVAPKWVSNRCQPVAVYDVIEYLTSVLGNNRCLNATFDIGGPDVLSYKQMLYLYARKRRLRRWILTVPVLTPKLSSYWLFFITSTSYSLARILVESLKNNAVCGEETIRAIIPKPLLTYSEALDRAFQRIEQNEVVSGWRDALSASNFSPDRLADCQPPTHGCLTYRTKRASKLTPQRIAKRLFHIGGRQGWYAMNWAWRMRGLIDRAVGGVGMQRGKTNKQTLHAGDAIDCWRVLVADAKRYRLLLASEMKLPGEAWLEIELFPLQHGTEVSVHAIFRPRGVWGRLYWWLLYPVHAILFPLMAHKLAKEAS